MTALTRTDTPNAEALIGLAFPVIRVRYAGPTNHRGSRYIATLRGVRVTRSYDCAENGSRNAYEAALACWKKYRDSLPHEWADAEPLDERVFIPGDLDADSYAFTVVPVGFLT